MELSLFLAQLMGLSIAFFAIVGFARPALLSAAVRDIEKETFSLVALAYITVIAGLAVVLAHNIWDGSWRTLVTIFGWSALLKGCLFLVAPRLLIDMSKSLLKNDSLVRGAMVVCFLLGAYLSYKGFGY